MSEHISTPWDGTDRRKSPRLHQLLDRLHDGIFELHRQVAAQAIQLAQLRADLNQLKGAGAKKDVAGVE